MEIRKIRDDERELAFYLGSQAFGFGTKEGLQSTEKRWDKWADYGVWDENGLQAKVRAIEFNIHMGQNVVAPMGGIAGVATWAHARGQGHVDKLLQESLVRMRDAGQTLSEIFTIDLYFYFFE